MRVFTLTVLMVLFSSSIIFAQALHTKVQGTPSTTTVVDKVKPPSNNVDATMYAIDFEAEVEWTFDFTPWTVNDVDFLPTYGFTGITFPHVYEEMAFIVFNPATTVPPMTDDEEIQPHTGDQFGACMAAVPSGSDGNDDWFISDQITLGEDASFTFWAKSYTADYGLERFNVAVSTTGNDPADFTVISGSPYEEAPVVWTEYMFDLSAYAGEDVYVAIQCVSFDAFVFMIDDLLIDPGMTPSDCDNFDSYIAGELLCPQSGGLWTTWDDDPGGPYDAYVSSAEYLSPPNSLSIDLVVMESDVVYDLNQTTTGVWSVALDILVPAGGTFGGYYNVMQDMELFGASNKWGFEVYFKSDGTGYWEEADNTIQDFTYTVGEWTNCELFVDLDNAVAAFYVDGVMAGVPWQWDNSTGPNMLGAVDIYASADGDDIPLCYIDNFCYQEVPVGIDPPKAKEVGIRLFPNPAQEFLNIQSESELVSVQVFNTVGQEVYTSKASGNSMQINTQSLEAGLYIVQIQTRNGFETQKFMKR